MWTRFLLLSCLLCSWPSYGSPIEILRANSVHVDAGSGAIIKAPSGRKYLITNSHVCAVSRFKGKVKGSFEGGEIVHGKVVKDSVSADLCAIEVNQKYAGIEVAEALYPKDEVCTRGYPQGVLTESCGVVGGVSTWEYMFPIELLGECPADTKKQYSKFVGRLVGCVKKYTSILSTLYARPGSSGSPVVNLQGKLVGVISDWNPANDAEAGMVPLRLVREFMKDL